MINVLPADFWNEPRTIFEPCCGKGNFVLGIFDKLYFGLENLYPNKVERCNIIMNKCLYFADISPLNVFITTKILKNHIKHYCDVEILEFN